MARLFQLGNNTHILRYERFKENDRAVKIFILEVADEEMISQGSLVPVEMMKALDLIDKTCLHGMICEHLRDFSLKSILLTPRKDGIPWYHIGYWKI